MRVCLTGGIACGKSLLAQYLNAFGVETLDADDIVHELMPSAEERHKVAAEIFSNPAARKALEARLHPLIRVRFKDWFAQEGKSLRVAIIPLLFEVGWECDYDKVICITAPRETQIRRMMETRGMTQDEALARLAAQMDVSEKSHRSDYVIVNDSTPAELELKAQACYNWLRENCP